MLAAMCVLVAVVGVRPAQGADPWLFVNDVHYDPTDTDSEVKWWGDPGTALLESTLAEMKRVAPDPPVIVMAGDFLSHHFKRETAIPTMVGLAHRFNRAFPHAQFVIALGNEDSGCGDYALAPDSAFIRAAAAAWEPLVDRNGAAPEFRRTFGHDGFYTARLPIPGVRVAVVDNAFWSTFYIDRCGPRGDPSAAAFAELERALPPDGTDRRWLLMHIPPGVDVASTVRRAHSLAIVPFMRPAARDRLLALIGDPARRMELVVTGHVHRFDVRIIDRSDGAPVPVLVAPAISPILRNAPSFLSAQVGPDGIIRNLEEHSYRHGSWSGVGGLRELAMRDLSGAAVLDFHRRLADDRALRERYARLYVGDARFAEITDGNWRSYWCGQEAFTSSAFRGCLDEGGIGFLTRRGVFVAVIVIAIGIIAVGAIGWLLVSALRRRRPRARTPRL